MYEVFEKLLKQCGVRVYEVAKATGIAPSMFTDWKKGRYQPKAEKLKKIADYFDVSVDYLMTGESQEQDYYMDDEAKELAQFLFENPEYRVLFDASRKVKRDDIMLVKELLDRFQ